jgi:hypothetical protein
MWRVPPHRAPMPAAGNDVILVECIRTRGTSFSFHRTARAILQAAQGLDSGKDTRSAVQSSPLEYPRFVSHQHVELNETSRNLSSQATSSIIRTSALNTYTPPSNTWNILVPFPETHVSDAKLEVDEKMEHVLALLCKDRLGPQVAGMEQLVSLTDPENVGCDRACHAALSVLGLSQHSEGNAEISTVPSRKGTPSEEIHTNWILELIVHRRLPTERMLPSGETMNDDMNQSFSFTGCTTSILGTNNNEGGKQQQKQSQQQQSQLDTSIDSMSLPATDEDHGGKMRALALRVVSNAICCMSTYQSEVLDSMLADKISPVWTSEPVLTVLLEDIHKGASRPVQAVYTTRLSSQHDTALSCRILTILAKHNPVVKTRLQQPQILEHLEQARTIGKSTHLIMSDEAHKLYQLVTEEDRSC